MGALTVAARPEHAMLHGTCKITDTVRIAAAVANIVAHLTMAKEDLYSSTLGLGYCWSHRGPSFSSQLRQLANDASSACIT